MINNGMKNLNIGCVAHCETVNDAWEYWYNELCKQSERGFISESRDGQVAGEFINAITIIDDPTRNLVTSPLRKMPMRYAVGELLWYLSGSNKLQGIQNFTSAWDRMSDDGEHVNSGYGHKIQHFYGFDQYEHVKKLLQVDPLSRQAIIHIKNASDEPSKDTPCTISLQLLIRDNKLHMTAYMRSNDVWMGVPYDMFAFTCLQMKMAMELEVGIGTYTHIAGSLHLYDRYLPKLEKEFHTQPKKKQPPKDESSDCGTDEDWTKELQSKNLQHSLSEFQGSQPTKVGKL